MSTKNTTQKAGDFIRTSATLKIISVGILVLVLLIPSSMISSLLQERKQRRDIVVQEINQKWGNSQTVTGPFFTVPYKSFYKEKDGTQSYTIQYFHLLPDRLNVKGEIDPHIRYRSIYEAVLYNCQLNVSGTFSVPQLNNLNIKSENILWQKSVFSVGITDMRGIKENVIITFDGSKYGVNPGLETNYITDSGVSSMIPLSGGDDSKSFSFKLNINGSEQLNFIPIAQETNVQIVSGWSSPSFNGSFLPAERKVSEDGFDATWKVLHLNRNFPQYWKGNQYKVGESAFGVKLIITADIYQKSTRLLKYAIVFVLFTFSAFFLSEIISKRRVHPIQYLLIGLAVILFYVLQLSLSEHLNFDLSYFLSAAVITLLIAGYSSGIIKSKRFTITVFAVLSTLYLYLYVVLRLEDYALLMGAVGLLIVLGFVMFITRKIDWYSLEDTHKVKS